MLGLTNSSDRLEGECGDMQFSSSVQAIVNIAGHTDLASLFMESKTMPGMIAQLLGGTPEQLPSQYFAASPINYISKDDPPVFSIQGTKDQANVPRQSELLDARMKEIGLPHTLIIKEGAGHGNFTNENGMWEFLDRVLKATNE
jgi:dipeptidyl aminopeptidase/acylaminoacyl peptidase